MFYSKFKYYDKVIGKLRTQTPHHYIINKIHVIAKFIKHVYVKYRYMYYVYNKYNPYLANYENCLKFNTPKNRI